MSMRPDDKYLSDMLQFAREALAIASGRTREEFDSARTLQLSLAHLIQIIGEAAYHVSSAIRGAAPDVPWERIVGMRHRLVHDYGNVSYAVIWEVVTRDLPPLIAALENFTPPAPPSA